MTHAIHIGNQPKSRKVTSIVAFVVITPLALFAGAVYSYYLVKEKIKDYKHE